MIGSFIWVAGHFLSKLMPLGLFWSYFDNKREFRKSLYWKFKLLLLYTLRLSLSLSKIDIKCNCRNLSMILPLIHFWGNNIFYLCNQNNNEKVISFTFSFKPANISEHLYSYNCRKLHNLFCRRWLHVRCLTVIEFQVRSPPGAFLCGVCMFSPCMRGFSPGTLASSHRPKTCMLD